MFRVVIIAVCMTAAFAANWEMPAFCNGNDCPVYNLLSNENGYEVRQYEEAQWVSTVVSASVEEDAQEKLNAAFGKLFQYIDGNNVRGQTIEMTAPVTTKVLPATSPFGDTQYTMSFYIPYDVQGDAPQPSSNDVFLSSTPVETVYVRYFSGFASQQDYMDNVMALSEALEEGFETSYYLQNGYDSPYKWWDRHNEVMLTATASKQNKH